MSTISQTGSRPDDPDDLASVPRPVTTLATDYPRGHVIAAHRHRRAQLVHAAAGVMTVTAGPGAWVVPPGRAVWVPAGMEHTIHAHGRLAMRTVYVAPDAVLGLPVDCFVVNVSPLLRELILAAMTMPVLYPLAGPEARLVAVLLDRIRAAHVAPLYLPLPDDSRLRRVADALVADPGDPRPLHAWAKTAGSSARTLARLFAAETGLSFRQWRQQARLLDALRRLAEGQPVTTVALDLGYESPSAFIAMFKKALGVTPGRYFD